MKMRLPLLLLYLIFATAFTGCAPGLTREYLHHGSALEVEGWKIQPSVNLFGHLLTVNRNRYFVSVSAKRKVDSVSEKHLRPTFIRVDSICIWNEAFSYVKRNDDTNFTAEGDTLALLVYDRGKRKDFVRSDFVNIPDSISTLQARISVSLKENKGDVVIRSIEFSLVRHEKTGFYGIGFN